MDVTFETVIFDSRQADTTILITIKNHYRSAGYFTTLLIYIQAYLHNLYLTYGEPSNLRWVILRYYIKTWYTT